MGRVIQSPVKRWPGSVTLCEPLNFPQYIAWRDAVRAASQVNESLTVIDAASNDEAVVGLLPALCGLIERWDLRGLPERVTPDTFPATPRVAAAALFAWLVNEVTALITDEEEVPKE